MINTDDCMLFAGRVSPKDYGYITVKINGKWVNRIAHRLLYELEYGDLPKHLVLDHLCRTTRCINLDHLEPVTNQENIRRGVFKKKQKSHCIHGHEFTPQNTVTRKDGRRNCRKCKQLYLNRWYANKKIQSS